MAASQDGLVTLRMVVCGGDLTYLSLVGWLAGHAGLDALIRESVFETRDALFAGWWTVVWSAEPMVLLRLAVVVGVRWVLEGTNQVEQWQRPIMMRSAEGTAYEL